MIFESFLPTLAHYIVEITPALAAGFFISGLVHELIPEDIILKYLGKGNIAPIFWSTLVGTFLPVCCWGSLPIAVSFYKKGARLGPVLAFLVATPATSISALLVTYSLFGWRFTIYSFFAVIVMGVVTGLIGNMMKVRPKSGGEEKSCPHCEKTASPEYAHAHVGKKPFLKKLISILHYAYVDLPREIGFELVAGVLLAAFVASFVPVRAMIKCCLSGAFGYFFSIIFGILMYLCATASVPLVHSLVSQGMNAGAGMTLLLLGPITSYGTILVLRKEYGMKVLIVFLASLIILTLMAGLGYQLIMCQPTS